MAGMQHATMKSIPFSVRFKAWWEGYPVEAVHAPKNRQRPPVNVEAKKAPAQPIDPNEPWGPATIEAAQSIWGQGFCGPCSKDYLEGLNQQLELQPNMAILQLGAGLGGAAQALADRYNVKVRGLEASKALVETSNAAGGPSQGQSNTRITAYNPEQLPGFKNKFDGAFSEEALFTVECKRELLSKVEEQLKPGGRLSFTEYMLGSDAAMGKENYQNWLDNERRRPHPIMLEELKDMLNDLQMQVHVSTDISPQFITMVKKAWVDAGKLATKLAEKPDGVDKIRALAKEAKLWESRRKIIESGDLRLWRVVARKKPGIRMLSDW